MTEEPVPHLPSPGTARTGRRITISQKLGVVFLLLVLLGFGNVVVVHGLLREFNGLAATVNIAGTLRYLSQKIALNTSNTLNGWAPGKDAAEMDIRDFETALDALQNGGVASGYQVRGLGPQQQIELDGIRQNWVRYRSHIEATLLSTSSSVPGSSQFGEITEGAARMLGGAERLMHSLTQDAQREQDKALHTTYLLLVIDMAVLAVVFVLMRLRMVQPLRMLVRYSRDLADGNYHVRLDHRSNDEVGELAGAFNDSAQRIGALIARLDQKNQTLAQAESMFRGVAENSMVGVYVAQNGRFRYVNAKMAEMFGYAPEVMVESVGVYDLVPDGDRDLVESNVQKRLRGDIAGVHYERRARRKDGSQFDVEVFGSSMTLEGEPATIGVMLDITQRKQAEASMQMAAMVYRSSSEAITITDENGIVLDINPAFTRITGYSKDDIVGKPIGILRSGRQDATFYQTMWHSLKTDGSWHGEIWNRRKNGEVYAERLSINTSRHPDGSVYRRIAIFSDITQKKKTEELVWRQANFDSLTGLPNRLMFRDRLAQEVRKAHRADLRMALMFIDLDRFKEINDTLGHAVGDNLLRQAAERLNKCVRESDTVARLGGDEFTLILGELSKLSNVERIVQDVLRSLAEPYYLDGEIAYVSASVGITFYPDDATDIDELLKNADQAMYAAKDLGRNRFHYFTPGMQAAAQERRRLAADLRSALAEGQLRVYYQPIVDLATGRLNKAEALVRWQHPTRGLVSPAEFIPIAEDTGMIVDIGEWVFQESVRHLARWRQWNAAFEVSINTSPIQYRNGSIAGSGWFDLLRECGVPPEAITVEITEGLLLDNNASITAQLLKCRDAGIQVSLDDFGTGYSSMSYLNKLDIDYLKIDRSFITGLTPDSENFALYEAMIVMAHKLGIKVVGEGIETTQQRDILSAAGCDCGQGYLFSRPVPTDEFDLLVQKSASFRHERSAVLLPR